MSWCFRCGEAGTPERAIGVDEDGEPACAIHREHDPRDFDQALRNKVEPAPPSPVQATEQEKADMANETLTFEQLQKGIKLKAAGKTVGQIGAELGIAAWKFYQSPGFKAAPSGIGEPVKLKKRKPSPPAPVELDEVCHEGESETPANEHVVTIRLPESKIAKLLELLLA